MRLRRSWVSLSVSDRRFTCWVLGIATMFALIVAPIVTMAQTAGSSGKDVYGYFGSAAAGAAGGQLNTPSAVAANEATGDLYVADTANNRIDEFSASGTFIRTWGVGVVSSGPDLGNEIQSLTVAATAGKYRLAFKGESTPELAYNAPPATVQSALEALSGIGAANVTVSGGPGDGSGSAPYTITFDGALHDKAEGAMTVESGPDTPLSGGAGASVGVIAVGAALTGFEVCDTQANPGDVCKAGVTSVATAGAMSSPHGVAVDQETGDVYVTDGGFKRVDEFSEDGGFIRAWGGEVIASGPGDNGAAFDVCTAADVCKTGVSGTTGGAFGAGIFGANFTGYLAVAPSGAPNAHNVLVADPNNKRVQEFSAEGVFIRTFGWGVNATSDTTGFVVCAAGETCKAGEEGSGTGEFGANAVTSVAEDSAGDVYTVEPTVNFRVQRFTLSDNLVTPQGTFAPALLSGVSSSGSTENNPTEIAVASALGDVYVAKVFPAGSGAPAAETQEQRVLKVSAAGELLETNMAGAGINSVDGLAINPGSGRLYLSSTADGERVYMLDTVPEPSVTVGETTAITAHTATLEGTVTPGGGPLDTSYRFEYSTNGETWTSTPTVNIGNGNGSGEPTACSPVNNPPSCAVSNELEGLEANRTYQVRLVATTEFDGSSTVASGFFTTAQSAPEATTVRAWWNGLESIELSGQVNAEGLPTTWYFQYGTSIAYGSTAPVSGQASVGSGGETQIVHQQLYGLQTGAVYHFRLVATNAAGTSYGTDQTLTPHGESRVYEMVSPLETGGANVVTGPIHAGPPAAPSGDAIGYTSFGTLPGSNFSEPELSQPLNPYVGQRSVVGWSTISGYAPTSIMLSSTSGGNALDGNPELTELSRCGGVTSGGDSGALIAEATGAVCAVRQSNGAWIPSRAYSTLGGGNVVVTYLGASHDLSHLFFTTASADSRSSAQSLLPSDSTGGGVYELSGIGTSDQILTEIDLNNSGVEIVQKSNAPSYRIGSVGPQGVNVGDTYQAISEDGAKVFFTREGVIYARDNGEMPQSPVEVNGNCTDPADACTVMIGEGTYYGASANGEKVFFTTTAKLASTDADTTVDLYEYNFAEPPGKSLIQLSYGGPGDANPGSGANVQGVVRVSEDGQRVYFVATGVLTTLPNGNDQTAQNGRDNLYVVDTTTGQLQFVGSLPSSDSALWTNNDGGGSTSPGRMAQTTPEGRYLVFSSFAQLITKETLNYEAKGGADETKSRQVYRYDAEGGELIRVSHGEGPGPASQDFGNNGNSEGQEATIAPPGWAVGGAFADANDNSRAISSNGEYIVFSTPAQLSAADLDDVGGTSCIGAQSAEWAGCNVYEWHDGAVTLLSDGQSTLPHTLEGSKDVAPVPSISASGADVFFTTTAALTPQDAGNTLQVVYDARLDGGVPDTPPTASCASSEGCRGQSSQLPSLTAPLTEVFFDGMNLAPPAETVPVKEPKPVRSKPKRKKLTRKQKLARALKACAKRPELRRVECERKARKEYGSASKVRHARSLTAVTRSKAKSENGRNS